MGATLSLKRPGSEEKPEPQEHGPAFDHEAHFGEVAGMEGVRYIQGKAMFNVQGTYVGPAPKHMWLAPLAAEQEMQRRKQLQGNKKFFGPPKNIAPGVGIPQAVINAERENAQARAAESQAA
jgi:hypothetical protein